MKKEQQTPELITRMYDLTRKYTRINQPQVYKQYTGDIDDLSSEVFCQFMTERGKDNKRTLLDAYDPDMCPKNMTQEKFFENLVKVSTRRLLIDFSRCDIHKFISLDSLSEKCGSDVSEVFDLALQDDITVDNMDMTMLRKKIESRLKDMSKQQIINLKSYYKQIKPALNDEFSDVFASLLDVK